MSTSRRANEAKPKDLLKIVRGNVAQLDPKDVLLTLDEFCEKHQEFLAEVLELTMRPTAKLLKNTFQQVWPGVLASDCSTMSNRIPNNYKTLFGKARKMASGDRVSEAVKSPSLLIRKTLELPPLSACKSLSGVSRTAQLGISCC